MSDVPKWPIAGTVVGVLMALSGAVWTLQGLGSTFVPQSFMTNNTAWIVIGLITLVAGLVLCIKSVSALRSSDRG